MGTAPKGSAGRVLVVDDEPGILRVVQRALQRHGYEPVVCGDVERARELLELVPFDAVLTDLDLPTGEGRNFVSTAVRAAPRAPVVVMTGHGDLREIFAMLDGSLPRAVIPKPFEPELLVTTLAGVLAQSAANGSSDQVRDLASGMARALGLRDVETEAHAQRVARWTRRLAEGLGKPEPEVFWCELGALLHDIGKIGVPDAILRKPGPLTPAEWEVMRRHPIAGHELLSPMPRLAQAAEIVLHHHERWDGSGYPFGLAGDAIPRGARIFAVVDCYDAITSDRPYRAGLGHEVAVARIVEQRGAQLDPEVVDAFTSIDRDEWQRLREPESIQSAAQRTDSSTSQTSSARRPSQGSLAGVRKSSA